MSSAYLQGALLIEAELVGANLTAAHLEGANLHLSRLVGANLTAAHLEGANLHLARLDGANLRAAHIEGADLSKAHLEGAWLIGVNLESANMEGAVFNDETVLSPDWLVMNSEKREEAQNKLRAMGARHVDDPPSGDAQGAVREGGADEVGAAGAV